MSTIKKAFQPIIDLLEANDNVKVKTILPEVIALCAAKTGSGGGKATKFHRDEAGTVVAIQCYYHKLWMDPRVVEFGKKATSPTGLNSMCKEGVSNWTKQQREQRAATEELLTKVSSGELAVEDIPAAQDEIAQAAARIEPREDGYGFETLEECILDSEARITAE